MKDRIDIVNELCAAIEKDPRSIFNIAQGAGVSVATLFLWLNGKTSNPNVGTLDRVARVLGLQLALLDGHWTLKPISTPASVERAAKRARMALWRLQ